ncbi:MAG TPA: hypothetical protein VLV83_09380, partial [Acidobacteriota bacterium]|nr:hypothetical protein [Acidobacteriota bacterium]
MNAPRHQVGPVLLLVLWTLILLSPCSLRAQQVFGDISLEPLDPAVDGADTLHGYAEYRFRLTNASGQRRVVELIAPFRGNGMSVPNQIDRIIRRVEVGPRSNLVVSLLQPPLMLPNGGQVRVRVDGEDFEEAFTFGPGHATMFVARLNFLFTRGAEPVEDALREAHKRRTGGPSSGG